MYKFRWLLWMLFGLALAGSAGAANHALIMTIGDYQAGIPRLKGVVHDRESARSIARLLGVRDEDMLEFHNEQLTLEGMQHAFDELDRRVAPGDRVFVYYSGHGSRQRVNDPEDRCAEALVAVNGQALIDAEMESRLKRLSGRAQKIIAMFDACHSGGATVRSIGGAAYAPKYWRKGGEDACEKPVNIVTRNLGLAARTAAGSNYVYIAAAKDNEISLDQPGKGGVATQSWLACMSGEAVDTDASGGLTVDEIRRCAQAKIDAQLKDAQGFLPHHINVTGNADLVMTLAGDVPVETPPVAATLPPVTVMPPVAPQPPVVAADPTVHEPVPEAAPALPATFQDIYNGRDGVRTVEMTPERDRLRIGKDGFRFTIRSSQAGYLYLLMAGSDGKTFDLLFPNKLDGDNYLQAGQALQLPRTTWEITAQGPRGRDYILAIVADAPRDLSTLPLRNAGPFSVVAATSGGKRGIQLVTVSPMPEARKECATAKQRTLAVGRVCSDAYGAAWMMVEEVE